MTLFIGVILILIIYGCVRFIVAGYSWNLGGNKEKPKYFYSRKQYLMTRAENACYQELVKLVGNEYYVFAQVHLSSLLNERETGQDWRAARAHINRKSVDFVLCDKQNISPKLAIELDDWSHAIGSRIERDTEVERILKYAGLPLLRIRDTQNLKENVAATLNESHQSTD